MDNVEMFVKSSERAKNLLEEKLNIQNITEPIE
jgi:hypothetical protein